MASTSPWYWLDEAPWCGYEAWQILKATLRQSGQQTAAWATGTPHGRDGYAKDFELTPQENHALYRASTWANAHNLPEGFVGDLGYLVGNGDEIEALGGHGTIGIIPTHWVGWNQLVAAQVNGMIAIQKVADKVEGTNVSNTIPTGWKDDGKTLIAPNGIPVVHGFRDYVLGHKWVVDNYPLAPEQVVSSGSIEPGNAAIGPGSRQDFRPRVAGMDNEP